MSRLGTQTQADEGFQGDVRVPPDMPKMWGLPVPLGVKWGSRKKDS